MRPENKRMQEFLRKNGVEAKVKYIQDGSLKKTWRLFNRSQLWSDWHIKKLTELGFTDNSNKPFTEFSGNGGMFSVFARGHYELLENESS